MKARWMEREQRWAEGEQSPQRLLLRPSEVAEMLGLGRSKTYDLIARGVIPSVKIDGAIRVPVDRLREFVGQLGGQA
jgi:excisionase family DNA binding protein